MPLAYISLRCVIHPYHVAVFSTDIRNVKVADHDCGMTKRGVENCRLTRDSKAAQTRVTVRHQATVAAREARLTKNLVCIPRPPFTKTPSCSWGIGM